MNMVYTNPFDDDDETFNPLDDAGYIDGIAQEARITELSDDQKKAIDFVRNFMARSEAKYKVVGGVAGSGKSTIIPYIINMVGMPYEESTGMGEVAVCAYTGKAVMNLKRKGVVTAQTLHSFLYETKVEEDEDGKPVMRHYPKPLYWFNTVKLLIVDEASMVSQEMHKQIMSLPFKTLYIGDHYQLPPVNDNFNIMLNPHCRLETIHRQEKDNPIVQLADMARHRQPIPLGMFGTSKHTRTLKLDDLPAYDEVITWTNATKDAVNGIIREKRGFQKDVPQKDDKMIVRVNCREKGVYNGQIIYLISTPTMNKKGGWNVEFLDELAYKDVFIMAQTDDATTALASIHLSKEEMDKIRTFPRYDKKSYKEMKKKYPYEIHLDWGYAITCHAAQGTSWRNVAVMLEDRMKAIMKPDDWSRWLYTAITRAEESVTIYSGDFRNL